MEIKFRRSQPQQIRIRDESRGKRVPLHVYEGRQCTRVGNDRLSIDRLLTDAPHDLPQIDVAAFAPAVHAIINIVALVQMIHHDFSRFFQGLLQHRTAIDALVSGGEDRLQRLVDFLLGRFAGDAVAKANTESIIPEKGRYTPSQIGQELVGAKIRYVLANNMHES